MTVFKKRQISVFLKFIETGIFMSVFYFPVPHAPGGYLSAMEYDETVYACAINRIFNYNCRDARMLTDMVGTPGEIFAMSQRELQEMLKDNGHYSSAVHDSRILKAAAEEVRWARNGGIRIIT